MVGLRRGLGVRLSHQLTINHTIIHVLYSNALFSRPVCARVRLYASISLSRLFEVRICGGSDDWG